MRAKSLTASAALLFATPSLADAPEEPVRLAYTAPDGCPSGAEVERELASKLGTSALARPDQLARRLDIVIERLESGFRARLELVDRAGNRVARQLRSPTCAQAAQAIVLVAALAAKAQRQTEAPAAPAPGPEPEPATPATPEPVTEAPRSSAGSARPPSAGDGSTELLLSFDAATGVGPGIAPGVGLATRHSLGSAGPAFVLGAGAHDSFRRETDAADARFRRFSGVLLACPFEPPLSESLSLSPCAGVELGAHSGRAYVDGERVVEGRSESLFFAQALLAARLRWRLEVLSFELGPELGVQLTENEFALRPDQPVYQVPAVTGALGVAIGLNLQAFSGR